MYSDDMWVDQSTLYRAIWLLERASNDEGVPEGFCEYKGVEKLFHGLDSHVEKAAGLAKLAAYNIASRIEDDDLSESLKSSLQSTQLKVPEEHEVFYLKLADKVEEVVSRDDVSLGDMKGHWMRRKDGMYEYPVQVIKNQLEDIPEGIICIGSRWTCPRMDWWASPIALVAVSKGITSIDEIQDYVHQEHPIPNPGVKDTQKGWESDLDNSDLINIFAEARRIGIDGEIPYKVLMAIGEKLDLELTDGGYLSLESKLEAKQLFEQMC